MAAQMAAGGTEFTSLTASEEVNAGGAEAVLSLWKRAAMCESQSQACKSEEFLPFRHVWVSVDIAILQ